jgi:CubicO group peptidase (beta-lactamase class C family)
VVTFAPATGTPAEFAQIGFDGTTWDRGVNLARGQITTGERMPSVELDTGGPAVPLTRGESLDVESLACTDPLTGRTISVSTLLDRRLYTDGLAVFKDGRLLFETYRNGMTDEDRHVVHSCTKTLTTMLVGVAVEEVGLDVSAPVGTLIEEFAAIPAWDAITLQHVLDMAAGLECDEDYANPESMYWRYAEAVGYYERPDHVGEGALSFAVRELTRTSEAPGTRFNYASYLTNLLPIAVERAMDAPALELLESRIYSKIGAKRPALMNVDPTGLPIVEGQLNLTLRDFARWGHLLMDGGRAMSGAQVVPEAWISETFVSDPARLESFSRGGYAARFDGAQYHNQTWLLEPGRVATMLGIHGQFCTVDRVDRVMMVGMSSFPDQTGPVLSAAMRELWTTLRQEI